MFKKSALIYTFLTALFVIISISCQVSSIGSAQGEPTPTSAEALADEPLEPTAVPQVVETEDPTPLPPTEEPEVAQQPEVEESPAEQPAEAQFEPQNCSQEVCVSQGSFLFARPIGPSGRNTIDPSYRFGDYRQAVQLTHRGVDFLNSSGTPVLAAAAGEVVVAGDDLVKPYGPWKDYYGNLVVLEHQVAGFDEPLFTLYGQLSELLVEAGESVTLGQEIGLVGMSGSAPGSTLHFEVRVGENSYQAVRNPELWLELLSDDSQQPLGALAGRVLDSEGNFQSVDNLVVEQLAGPGLPAMDQFYLRTYEKKELLGLGPWEESFALGDLPAGEYQITFMLNGVQQKVVEVEPGMLTMVTFVVN